MFVEDINLVRLAELSIGHEFFPISGEVRAFDRKMLESQFAVEAAGARHALQTFTERTKVRSSFRVVRGHVDAEVITAAGRGDLLVMGMVSRSVGASQRPGSTALAVAERASRSVLFLRRGTKIIGRPIVVHDGSEGSDVALDAAARFVSRSGEALTVLLVPVTTEAADALQARVTEHLASSRIVPRLLRAPGLELDELCQITHRSDPDVLVIDANSSVLAGKARERLLEDVGCSILLVR